MGGPMWGITATSLLDIKAKPYDRTKWGLLEENKSIALWANMPYNTGNNMSSNHTFGGSIKFTDRNANVIKDVDDETDELIYLDSTEFRYLNIPVSGKERSEEHTSELQSRTNLVCRLLLEKKKTDTDRLSHSIYQTHSRPHPLHQPALLPSSA